MDPGDAYVEDALEPNPEHAHGLCALLGDGHVARPGADEGDLLLRQHGDGRALERTGPCDGVVAHLGHVAKERVCLRVLDARDQDVLSGARELVGDRDDLLGRLAFAEDHLRHALPQRAVMIDDGKAEVSKRELPQLRDRVGYLRPTASNAEEQFG